MKVPFIVSIFCLLIIQVTFSQEPGQEEGQIVIDLTKLGKTYTISARMELPQIRMFDRRITPDFKEVAAEKSFINELSPQAEEIKYEPITSGRVEPIKNIEALLNKKRL